MEKNLVSIIIPIYNMEMYLKETLESVVHLTYRPLEVILVDDGSTDRSIEIATQYAEQYDFIHFYANSNHGVAYTRNFAITQSQGEYIIPLDSDDLIHDGFLQEAVAILASRPEVKLVTGSNLYIGDRSGEWVLPEFDIKLFARKNIIPPTILYRRSDFNQTSGYCPEIPWNEDWDFWIAMLKTGGEVLRLPIPAYSYRRHQGSRRNKYRNKKKELIQMLNQRHPEFFKQHLGGPLRQMRTWSAPYNRIINLFRIKISQV